MADILTPVEARDMVLDYITHEGHVVRTQDILNSGAVLRLKGFIVRPGKVSDSIFGGRGSFEMKKADWEHYKSCLVGLDYVAQDFVTIENGATVHRVNITFENPLLLNRLNVPVRIMVRTEKISTHDLGRGDIPFKDQILATNHNFMRKKTDVYLGSSQYSIPGLEDSSIVIVAEDLTQISFENVLRAYMAKTTTPTSLYVHYMAGERVFCGHELPDNLFPNGPLPYLMDTPSTKSDQHDESVPPDYLFDQGVCTPEQYARIKRGSFEAFFAVASFLKEKGLILVDTKIEHGIDHNGAIVSQDELFTLDSSRFWLSKDYNSQRDELMRCRIEEISPKSFSKEFARGFSKGDSGYTQDERVKIAVRYIEGIQLLLGNRFEPDMRPREERVISGLETVVQVLAL